MQPKVSVFVYLHCCARYTFVYTADGSLEEDAWKDFFQGPHIISSCWFVSKHLIPSFHILTDRFIKIIKVILKIQSRCLLFTSSVKMSMFSV
jgi:hypothetical protein